MKENIIEALFLWLIAFAFFMVRNFLRKIEQKSLDDSNLKERELENNNYKKYYSESLQTYIKMLGFGMWFLVAGGLYFLLKNFF